MRGVVYLVYFSLRGTHRVGGGEAFGGSAKEKRSTLRTFQRKLMPEPTQMARSST